MTCQDCPPGFGRGEGCKCVRCIPGITYSSNTSPDECEPCRKCTGHQEEDRACTIKENRLCKCKKTFARHRVTDDCTQCCFCKTNFWKERTPACMHRKDGRHCMAKSHVGICDEDVSFPKSVNPTQSTVFPKSVNPTQSTVFQQMNESMAVRGSTLYQEILSTSSYHYVVPTSTVYSKSINVTDYRTGTISNTFNPLYILTAFLPFIAFVVLIRKAWRKRQMSKKVPETEVTVGYLQCPMRRIVPTEVTVGSLKYKTFKDLEKALEPDEAWKEFGFRCVEKFESDTVKKSDLNQRIEGCGQRNIAEKMFALWETKFPDRTVKTLRQYATEFNRQDIIQCLEGIQDTLVKEINRDLKARLCSCLNSVVPNGIEDCRSFLGEDFTVEEIRSITTVSAKDQTSCTCKMLTIIQQQFGKQPLHVLSNVSEDMCRGDVKIIFDNLITVTETYV